MNIKYPILGYAPGYYSNTCCSCKTTFLGDKYARQCEQCAINMLNENYKKVYNELIVLKKALKEISFSNDKINKIINNEKN